MDTLTNLLISVQYLYNEETINKVRITLMFRLVFMNDVLYQNNIHDGIFLKNKSMRIKKKQIEIAYEKLQ